MRLFIAIPVGSELQRRLLRMRDRIDTGGARVRWCTPEQMHLTLKFLGERPEAEVPPICQAVERVAAQMPTFELSAAGCGCFPEKGSVRVIWVGVTGGSSQLSQLFQQLEAELSLLGIPPEKRTLSLHFTLGRVKYDPTQGRLRQAVEAAPFEDCPQDVTELRVYQSTLTPGGARYTVISRAELSR